MHIQQIDIKNFRLLKEVSLSLEAGTTVIVGRNNSGKTSLTELFRRLLSANSASFKMEDFSLPVHEDFWRAYQKRQNGEDESVVRETLPAIEICLSVNYESNTASYEPLNEFIIDLEPDCTEALIKIRYELKKGKLDALFENIEFEDEASTDERTTFFKTIKDRIPKFYDTTIYAEDPNDNTNRKDLEARNLHALLKSDFINAQRGLDDATDKGGVNQNILGSILERLFTIASDSENQVDKEVINKLDVAVQDIQGSLDAEFKEQLKNLFPLIVDFGYPGLGDPDLQTETILDAQRLLINHTKVNYAGINGINLPETYNGLGSRNLIYILLQLLGFYKDFTKKGSMPGMHLVFIEEPEAHLHPQMQEVFIAHLDGIADLFAKNFGGGAIWSVQFVVTTHSSHLANKAQFEAIRYFSAHPRDDAKKIRMTTIKDLSTGLVNTLDADKGFLQKYMTLTRCDLFFADKIVLIEGKTERIMLPEIIKRVDEKLSSQYISVMEVGGSYAHKFFGLLNFLDLKTLIITDIDTVDADSKSCKVADGVSTSNPCIKNWFANDVTHTPTQLLSKQKTDKIKGRVRLAYQIPEDGSTACGRSFEDAFILANYAKFEVPKADAEKAYNKASKYNKIDFAIKYGIENTEWVVPLYIVQGLNWLAPSDENAADNGNTE